MESATLDVEFDEDQATRIITSLVVGKPGTPGMINLFSSFPEYTIEDLVSEGMVGVLRQWGEYDPDRGAKSTFIQQRAYTSIINLQRSAKSGKNKIKRLKDLAPEAAHHDVLDDGGKMSMVEWAARSLEMAQKQFGKKLYRKYRKFYRLPQLVAIASIMQRFKYSARSCVEVLKERPDVCEVLHLRRVPSHDSLTRALKVLAEVRAAQSDAGTETPRHEL